MAVSDRKLEVSKLKSLSKLSFFFCFDSSFWEAPRVVDAIVDGKADGYVFML